MSGEKPVIRICNLGKKYRLGGPAEIYSTFRDAVVNSFKSPFRQGTIGDSTDFWALRGVTFDVERGEVVGIIGRNGAGKSTLLKILSRITTPTEGSVELNGRVGSLLEVGTGFHPELTGRENIFLSGSLLGMKKREIEDKLDEIVKFSEIEQFLDTPVKRYSSGMYVRLAFSVAAHLEPEILLVDEVLAVGDAAFQKKCLGKMGDVAREGRTVLFVSHNMGLIGQLCPRAILLDQGAIKMDGPVEEVIGRYLEIISHSGEVPPLIRFEPDPEKIIQIRSLGIYNNDQCPASELDRSKPFFIQMVYQVNSPVKGATFELVLEIEYPVHTFILRSYDTDMDPDRTGLREAGSYVATIHFPGMLFNAGRYQIRAWIWKPLGGQSDRKASVYDEVGSGKIIFTLHDGGTFASYAIGQSGTQRQGLLGIPLKWDVEKKEINLFPP